MIGFGDPTIGNAPPARCAEMQVAALRAAPDGGARLTDAGAVPLADVDWLAALPRLPDPSGARSRPNRRLNLFAGMRPARTGRRVLIFANTACIPAISRSGVPSRVRTRPEPNASVPTRSRF